MDRNLDRLFVALGEVVYPNQDALVGVDLLLVAVCRIRDFALRKTTLDGVQHATHLINARKIIEAAALESIR